MRWKMYWSEEPWGAYRDNMHAAMIVSELLRPHLADGKPIPMINFMLEHPDDRRERAQLATALKLEALARASKARK